MAEITVQESGYPGEEGLWEVWIGEELVAQFEGLDAETNEMHARMFFNVLERHHRELELGGPVGSPPAGRDNY